MTEWILHIDGDGFFAYCEIARFPHLKGTPVVVGEDRGIVCACTYEAKALGITRAMPIFKVREQFPQVTILSSHFELYDHYARKLAALLDPEVEVLERYSIDECFAIKTFPEDASYTDLHTWLQGLKMRVQAATGLTYSFGLARTKVLAKVASKREKPDGCTVLTPEEETTVLQETSIESIWGIGWKTGRRFQNMNLKTAYEFAQWLESRVMKSFALPLQELWHELNGRRMFAVSDKHSTAKSLQATKSFTPTSSDADFIIAELIQNTDIVFSRMRKQGLMTNGVSIFLKTKERRYHSTAIPLPHFTNNPLDAINYITTEAKHLLQANTRYRSTGITVWNLRPQALVQEDLFGVQHGVTENANVMKAVDAIRHKYGQGSIGILASMPSTTDRIAKGKMRRLNERYVYGLPLPYLGEVH
jgi:nucleotidyltransferase/DNA polymerase involved in DNA repair